jgi:glutathione-regulated potassium-efflux system ancillary protein KefF
MSRRVYALLAHPTRQRSRANALVRARIADLPQVTLVDLYDRYPGFHIDVQAEQQRLREHDILLLQHPIYWYGMPPLAKLWMDEVLEMGFAYGEGERALQGKIFQLSVTTGGDAQAYSAEGMHGFPFESFLPPYQATAKLCRMQYAPPLVLHRAVRASQDELEAHAESVRDRIIELTNPLYAPELLRLPEVLGNLKDTRKEG